MYTVTILKKIAGKMHSLMINLLKMQSQNNQTACKYEAFYNSQALLLIHRA